MRWRMVALLAEGVGRNFSARMASRARMKSPSSRRAWVEIKVKARFGDMPCVALLAEGVGRNRDSHSGLVGDFVALLAEGVDKKGFLASSGISQAG